MFVHNFLYPCELLLCELWSILEHCDWQGLPKCLNKQLNALQGLLFARWQDQDVTEKACLAWQECIIPGLRHTDVCSSKVMMLTHTLHKTSCFCLCIHVCLQAFPGIVPVLSTSVPAQRKVQCSAPQITSPKICCALLTQQPSHLAFVPTLDLTSYAVEQVADLFC